MNSLRKLINNSLATKNIIKLFSRNTPESLNSLTKNHPMDQRNK